MLLNRLDLDDLAPFKPEEKIIEYLIRDKDVNPLINMSLMEFANETASESMAPGGGSIAAYVGTLGVSLGGMVANLSSHKRGWDERWEEFSNYAVEAQAIKDRLLFLVDEDTNSFNQIMDAFGLPKDSEEELNARKEAIQEATRYATEIPFQVMETSYEALKLCQKMAEIGNPNSVTDAGVGALCARTAVLGAFMNVRINAAGLTNKEYAKEMVQKGQKLHDKAIQKEAEVMHFVNTKI